MIDQIVVFRHQHNDSVLHVGIVKLEIIFASRANLNFCLVCRTFYIAWIKFCAHDSWLLGTLIGHVHCLASCDGTFANEIFQILGSFDRPIPRTSFDGRGYSRISTTGERQDLEIPSEIGIGINRWARAMREMCDGYTNFMKKMEEIVFFCEVWCKWGNWTQWYPFNGI